MVFMGVYDLVRDLKFCIVMFLDICKLIYVLNVCKFKEFDYSSNGCMSMFGKEIVDEVFKNMVDVIENGKNYLVEFLFCMNFMCLYKIIRMNEEDI